MMTLPEELRKKLKEAQSDMEACKLLADNGIDPEKFEQSLPDGYLENVSGGYDSFGIEIRCPECKTADKDRISRQFWASMFADSATKYRCRECGCYFMVKSNGSITKY